ncbi:MAG: hypothetical protein L6W00_02785 [Lentisphaeria bacterium]|nr:MAG: hypothetical protein L6W00_02785 [Lentisphaeria bacterium]
MKDIREFGAIGDGRVDDTSAIQAALQGGGLIVVPAGRYLTGTLYLESDTELRLAPGAELLASTDPAAYNPAQFSPENTLPSVTERVSARHLLIAIGKKKHHAFRRKNQRQRPRLDAGTPGSPRGGFFRQPESGAAGSDALFPQM